MNSDQSKAKHLIVDDDERDFENEVQRYAAKILRSHAALMSGTLKRDYEVLTQGRAIYLRSMMCAAEDFRILQGLTSDLNKHGGGMIEWSKHHKFEDPDMSPVFNSVVARLARYFSMEVYATRLNFYSDGSSWKPFHHDSHAGRAFFQCGGIGPAEDFTIGASFGSTRELAFLHVDSQAQFSFPQANGDVFAFDGVVNQTFQHGVPRATGSCGPRFSIIAWGRRVLLTKRNAPAADVGSRDERGKLVFPEGRLQYGAGYVEKGADGRVNAPGPSMDTVGSMVSTFVEGKQQERERLTSSQEGKNGRKRNARIAVGGKK